MRQLTFAPHGHILTNAGVWSPDGQWIVYDVRSDLAGSTFDGDRIEAVHVETGEVQVLYRSTNGAHCGVASWHPREFKVVFILGPESPTADYSYGPSRRGGVIVVQRSPGIVKSLDARDLTPPFTAGALRGGTHLHLFSPDGQLICFTYEDDVVQDQRNVGVCFPRSVEVPENARAQSSRGLLFSFGHANYVVAATRIGRHPSRLRRKLDWNSRDRFSRRRSFIRRADSDRSVYRQPAGRSHHPGDGPLQGTVSHRPIPPAGVRQRRLTFTTDRKYPGIQVPRHWLRGSPDGSRIAALMKDDDGIVQIWLVSPSDCELRQLTRNAVSIGSAFTWSPDGRHIAHVLENYICLTDTTSGTTIRIASHAVAPRAEACVFSPDGRTIACVCPVETSGGAYFNQVFVAKSIVAKGD